MEKLSSFASLLHMFNDFCNLDFIFFFGILLIEDTVFFMLKSNTSKKMSGIHTKIGIINFLRSISASNIPSRMYRLSRRNTFIAKMTIRITNTDIITVLVSIPY